MKVLLSIKPKYSEKIFSGEKKFEFRRTKPKSKIDFVLVYESSPSCYIVGAFTVKKIISGEPNIIWEKCKHSSGIEKSYFEEYCINAEVIHAIEIDKIFKFKEPMNPFKIFVDFKPPQSFCYLNPTLIPELTQTFEEHQGLLDQFDLEI